jgi:hypothetical protein
MTITRTNGWFSGTVTPPGVTGETISSNGTVLQNQTNGFGFFRRGGQSGWLMFGPAQ